MKPFNKTIQHCPKCLLGTMSEFKYVKPVYSYELGEDMPERLDVTCRECGYTEQTKTKPEAEEPTC